MPLVLASTPIGNVDDASPRLRQALAAADVIAAEDTRRLRRLLASLDIEPAGRVISYYDQNEEQRAPGLLDELRAGGTVVVVSDAGTPLISDPGYRLVSAAVAEGLPVRALPGPSAVTTALAVSGLAVARWCFEGFPPRKAGERRRLFAELAREPRTMVFFEAPHRLHAMLSDLADAFGAQRPAAVCRELSKTYEEVRRGSLGELVAWSAADVRGEVTVVVAGAEPLAREVTDDELADDVRALIDTGVSTRDAAAQVAAARGVARRRVYDVATRRS